MNEYLLFYKISSNMVFLISAKLTETEQNKLSFLVSDGNRAFNDFFLAVFENYFPCGINP